MDQSKFDKDSTNSLNKTDIAKHQKNIVHISVPDYLRFEAAGIVRRSSVHNFILQYHRKYQYDQEPLVYSVLTDKFMNI